MASVLIIFSGLTFTYDALDRAIAQAKHTGAGLQVLFLVEKPVEEGYVYPSDIDAAESLTNSQDTATDDRHLLHSKINLIRDKVRAEGIACSIQVSNDPSVDAVLAAADNVSMIFVDVGTGGGEGAAGSLVDPKALSEKATCPVEVVGAL